jgi:hypothetical protein
VIIGYAADDPPMRYLLDVIDADRDRFRDLRYVYAFVPAKEGEEPKQRALWDAKGAIPILYRVSNNSDHSSLYTALEQWASYAADPTDWRKSRLRLLLSGSPAAVGKSDLEEVKSLLIGGDAAENLEEINPSPAWMSTFSDLQLLRDDWRPHLPWICKNLTNPKMFASCLSLALAPGQIQFIKSGLFKQQATISPLIAHAWRLLVRARANALSTQQAFGNIVDSGRRLKAGDSGYDVGKALCAVLRPRVQLATPFRLKPSRSESSSSLEEMSPSSLEEIVTVDFGAEIDQAGPQALYGLLADIPNTGDVEFQLAEQLARELVDALHEAADANFILPTYDRASHLVPSVAKHAQNQYARGFYGLVRLVADLWERAALTDVQRAKKFTTWCLDQRYVLLKRIGLHFLSVPQVHSGAEASAGLLALSDELFWRQARREQLRLMAERWNDFPVKDRQRLEARLLAGPPGGLFQSMSADELSRFASTLNHSVFVRLTRIVQAGGKLSENATCALADLKTRNPDFVARPDDQEDFDVWIGGGGFRGPRGDTSKLRDIGTSQLVQEAIRIETEQSWEQGDLWSVFCRDEPDRALTAMETEADAGRWNPTAWRPFLDAFAANKRSQTTHRIVALLLRTPDELFSDSMYYVTNWLERQRATLAIDEALLSDGFGLWDRLARQVFGDNRLPALDKEASADVIAATLSEPGGMLVEFLVQLLVERGLSQDAGLPGDIKPRATIAALSPGRSGLLARVSFARRLAYLDYIDHQWTKDHLIKFFSWTKKDAKFV